MTRKEYQERMSVLKNNLQKYGKKCSITYSVRLHKNKRTDKFAGAYSDWYNYYHTHNHRYGRRANGGLLVLMHKQEPIEVLLERYNNQTFDGIHRRDIIEITELRINY